MENISFIITARPERASLLALLPQLYIQKDPKDEVFVVSFDGMGWYENLNRVAAMSRAAWLCFPNDDGYIMPNFVPQFRYNFPDADLIYCNVLYDGRGRGPYGLLNTAPKVNHIDKMCYMVRRSIFDAVGGFPKVEDVYRIDGIFVERVASNGARIKKINDILVVHN